MIMASNNRHSPEENLTSDLTKHEAFITRVAYNGGEEQCDNCIGVVDRCQCIVNECMKNGEPTIDGKFVNKHAKDHVHTFAR